jgi:hypothetical protein
MIALVIVRLATASKVLTPYCANLANSSIRDINYIPDTASFATC